MPAMSILKMILNNCAINHGMPFNEWDKIIPNCDYIVYN